MLRITRVAYARESVEGGMDDLIKQLAQRFGVPEETIREKAGPQLEQLASHLPGGGENVAHLLEHPMFAGLESKLGGMFQGTPLAGLASQFGLGGGAHEAAAGGASESEQAAERIGDDPSTAYAEEDGAADGGRAGTGSEAFVSAEDDPYDQDSNNPGPEDTGDTEGVTGESDRAPSMGGEGDAETEENGSTDAIVSGEDEPTDGEYDADAGTPEAEFGTGDLNESGDGEDQGR